MFERFTERARLVVVFAQEEARGPLRHTYIGTEHILLGLLREEEGLASRVLATLDITLDEVRAQVVRIVGEGNEVVSGQMPFTPRAKKVLELALREALILGHNYVGTEHILLGLVRDNEGVATRILLDFDADAEKIRNEIIRRISGPGRRGQRPVRASIQPELSIKVNELVASLPHSAERAELETAVEAALGVLTVGQLVDAARLATETCIEHEEYESAARFREIQRKLVKAARAASPPQR